MAIENPKILNVRIKNPPISAIVHIITIVLISPERINEITMNVKKKIRAVPKSCIRKSAPIHPKEKMINFVRLLLDCNFSREAAPTKINATFTNSDG